MPVRVGRRQPLVPQCAERLKATSCRRTPRHEAEIGGGPRGGEELGHTRATAATFSRSHPFKQTRLTSLRSSHPLPSLTLGLIGCIAFISHHYIISLIPILNACLHLVKHLVPRHVFHWLTLVVEAAPRCLRSPPVDSVPKLRLRVVCCVLAMRSVGRNTQARRRGSVGP